MSGCSNKEWPKKVECQVILSKINQGSRLTRVSTGFLLFTLFLHVTHSLQVKKCQISQRNCQIKFKFDSKKAIITSPVHWRPLAQNSGRPKSWCIQDPGKQVKKIFKQSEEIVPLKIRNISTQEGSGNTTLITLCFDTDIEQRCLKQGWKKPRFFFKKTQSSVFFVFLGFWVILGFFRFFCPEERVLGVFSVSRILLGASRL